MKFPICRGTITLLFLAFLLPGPISAQEHMIEIGEGWQFRQVGNGEWRSATVPGTVHTDLLRHGLIPDPYFGTNEKTVQWVGETDWEYKTSFNLLPEILDSKLVELVFDGLDTYADVYVNGRLLIQADNMFRQWRIDLKPVAAAKNEIIIRFHSAKRRVDSIAAANRPFVVPDNNRAYARKAQYHFGWDWGPILITSGIWQKVYLQYGENHTEPPAAYSGRKVELVQDPDSIGRTFYFRIDGKPVYMKGANYIPSDVFLPNLKRSDYEKIIRQAKDANMNMLRVWGGGIYEQEDFYELCDQYGIMVWQDFMFAGAMIPDDEAFFKNVREEVKYQVERLRKFKCIVVWCGNNEVDEAWHNWGWQKQFGINATDSARLWNAYKRLFRDSLPAWVSKWDGTRPYISTSPMHGWGRQKSFTEGDSHYWGVWWGLQDIEVFETKTGRFVSEYGMQAMPNLFTTYQATAAADRFLFSDALKAHQKHPTGYQNIQSYLHRYFLDSALVKQLSLEDYTYLTQCLQFYCFKNIIAIHRSKYPVNMGTLLWQLNDCWPVCSWSISDYSRQPKAAWYGVREAYRDDVLPKQDSIRPKDLKLSKPTIKIRQTGKDSFVVESDAYAKYVQLYTDDGLAVFSDNYFDLPKGEKKHVVITETGGRRYQAKQIRVRSLSDILMRK